MEYEYEKLLARARENASEIVKERGRFVIPKVIGRFEGNKTVITNFSKIIETLNRPPEHILKFILRELATPGIIRGGLLMLGAKIPAGRINEKLVKYTDEYVLCTECGKPDTTILKEGEINYLRCQACGAKKTLKGQM